MQLFMAHEYKQSSGFALRLMFTAHVVYYQDWHDLV